MDKTSPLVHPERLGKYQVTGVLGEGAMGVVYKGFDPGIQRAVAGIEPRPPTDHRGLLGEH